MRDAQSTKQGISERGNAMSTKHWRNKPKAQMRETQNKNEHRTAKMQAIKQKVIPKL